MPITAGSAPSQWPSMNIMSLWQIAQAISFTFTSPRSGSAMATSSIETGWPTSRHTAAFNFFSSRPLKLSVFRGNILGMAQAKPETRGHTRRNIPSESSVFAKVEGRREVRGVWILLLLQLPVFRHQLTPSQSRFCHKIETRQPRHQRQCQSQSQSQSQACRYHSTHL